jgi:hypothetical protein
MLATATLSLSFEAPLGGRTLNALANHVLVSLALAVSSELM